MVVFRLNESPHLIAAHAQEEHTVLTAFFELHRINIDAQQYTMTYQQIPQHFVWDRDQKKWKHRQLGETIGPGLLYFVSPTVGERFYLRTLLTTVKGPTKAN
jgi:hypothetical protein